ncbi:hypothetical protein KSX_94080 [Ktedonospora formicarum]|uniref:Uncharacterized protein n=1 Tax=Ktedonospora formicarum TaxID=2778364 RepID=A0A8J3MZX9_9CHLR|nr:hypothetical protein KSX_94080 [Ktedonospora formicarum]
MSYHYAVTLHQSMWQTKHIDFEYATYRQRRAGDPEEKIQKKWFNAKHDALGSEEMSLTEIGPEEISPAQIESAEIGLAPLCLAEVSALERNNRVNILCQLSFPKKHKNGACSFPI